MRHIGLNPNHPRFSFPQSRPFHHRNILVQPRTKTKGKYPAHVFVDKAGMSQCVKGKAASRHAIYSDFEPVNAISSGRRDFHIVQCVERCFVAAEKVTDESMDVFTCLIGVYGRNCGTGLVCHCYRHQGIDSNGGEPEKVFIGWRRERIE
jgi:hypothetical protein